MGFFESHGRYCGRDGETALEFYRHARPCAGHPRLSLCSTQDVDGRDKPGHDDVGSNRRMKQFRTLDDVDVKGKRVLLRVDLNVPMEGGRVTDATRLERIAPTITEISGKGGKV